MRPLTILGAGALTALCAHLPAQVFINEVEFDPADQWIELYNSGTETVDIGGWSIYHATMTPFRTGTYWWALPNGTQLFPDSYLRVHWGEPIDPTAPPFELYTGDSHWNFLFGHGYETLNPDGGALALCTTQDNFLVNNANIFHDWLQWGETGFARESIAVNNQPDSLWTSGTFLPKTDFIASLIRIDSLDSNPPPLSAYALDSSPTPNGPNTDGMSTSTMGTSCGLGSSPAITLTAEGSPFFGNADFAIRINNTQGPTFAELAVLVLSLDGATASYPGIGCSYLTSPAMIGFPTDQGSTLIPIPILIPAAIGLTAYMQAGATNPTRELRFSNTLQITVSN